MMMIAFDLETHAITDDNIAPRMVCGSMAVEHEGGVAGYLLSRDQAFDIFQSILDDPTVIIVGANIAFDFGVMVTERPEWLAPVLATLRAGRVYDVQLAQGLEAIAGGYLGSYPDGHPMLDDRGKITKSYSLAKCVEIALGRTDAKKNDTYRLLYGDLEAIPMSDWPEEAKQYPIDDAVNTLEVAIAQKKYRNLSDMAHQARKAFALHLGAMEGISIDVAAVETLAASVAETKGAGEARFISEGLLRVDVSRDTDAIRKAVLEVAGGDRTNLAITPKGEISIARKVLRNSGDTLLEHLADWKDASDAATEWLATEGLLRVEVTKNQTTIRERLLSSGVDESHLALTAGGDISIGRQVLEECHDPLLQDFAEWQELDKIESTYLPALRGRSVLHPHANPLLDNGRVSYRGIIQTAPKKGGVRECFVGGDGHVLLSHDYSQLEILTFAQICKWVLGYSKMADIVTSGRKLHTHFAAKLLGLSYEKCAQRVTEKQTEAVTYYDVAKRCNFGLLGGMGAHRFALTAHKERADLCRAFGYHSCVIVSTDRGPICARCMEYATEFRNRWRQEFPDAVEYFDVIARIVDNHGFVEQLMPDGHGGYAVERIRGGVDFSAACNTMFSALAARGATAALWDLTELCYLNPDGTIPLAFIHDENICKTPIARAEIACERVTKSMENSMRHYVPDLAAAVKVSGRVMERWTK